MELDTFMQMHHLHVLISKRNWFLEHTFKLNYLKCHSKLVHIIIHSIKEIRLYIYGDMECYSCRT